MLRDRTTTTTTIRYYTHLSSMSAVVGSASFAHHLQKRGFIGLGYDISSLPVDG